jgi:O-acetyl-ADP-ribose deacetylase (regulator of RNase III)
VVPPSVGSDLDGTPGLICQIEKNVMAVIGDPDMATGVLQNPSDSARCDGAEDVDDACRSANGRALKPKLL